MPAERGDRALEDIAKTLHSIDRSLKDIAQSARRRSGRITFQNYQEGEDGAQAAPVGTGERRPGSEQAGNT